MCGETLRQSLRTSVLPRLRFMTAKIGENQEGQSGCWRDRNARARWTGEKMERMEGGLTSGME